jgi:hypothetical protein
VVKIPQINLIIDNAVLEKYNKYYFHKYPKRKKAPIEKAIPPSLNKFISMIRMAQNNLKQKYKEFAIWLSEYYKINNLNLENSCITYTFYFKDKRRRDYDNLLLTPKLLNDGFVEAKVFVDDNGDRLKLAFNQFQYDKLNPRVEMLLEYQYNK